MASREASAGTPIFCRWDVLGRLWLTADALTVPSVGPKFRGGVGVGSIARRDLRLVALELGGEHVAAAGGEAIQGHPRTPQLFCGTSRAGARRNPMGEFIGVRIRSFLMVVRRRVMGVGVRVRQSS